MIFVILLGIVAFALLIFGIFFTILEGDFSNDDSQKRSAAELKRQTEILERNRMESYSRSDYFRGDKP